MVKDHQVRLTHITNASIVGREVHVVIKIAVLLWQRHAKAVESRQALQFKIPNAWSWFKKVANLELQRCDWLLAVGAKVAQSCLAESALQLPKHEDSRQTVKQVHCNHGFQASRKKLTYICGLRKLDIQVVLLSEGVMISVCHGVQGKWQADLIRSLPQAHSTGPFNMQPSRTQRSPWGRVDVSREKRKHEHTHAFKSRTPMLHLGGRKPSHLHFAFGIAPVLPAPMDHL